MSWYCLADDVKLEDAARARLGNVQRVLARDKVLHCALPQDAALMVELHDARGHGAVNLQKQLAALLPERELVCNPAGADGGGAVGRTDGT